MKITDFLKKKQNNDKITVLTCYDYPSACTIAESAIDCVLIGDSVAMAVHGHEHTLMATLDMMVLHTKAVSRAIKQQLIITDLPFLCHRISLSDTVSNVKQLIQAGAQAIKIEGADKDTCHTISYLVTSGIPIIGHLGLTPQYVHQFGGYKVQGKEKGKADFLIEQATQLEEAGCSALVLECIPQALAQTITKALKIPTIGIGAGSVTDGQVLVWHDILGLQDEFKPKFLKQYLQGKALILNAINVYVEEVKSSQFPSLDHAF